MRLQKGPNSSCKFTKLAINETSEWSQRKTANSNAKRRKFRKLRKFAIFS